MKNRLRIRKLKIMSFALALFMPASIIDASTYDYDIEQKTALVRESDNDIKEIEYNIEFKVLDKYEPTETTVVTTTTPVTTTTIPVTTTTTTTTVDLYEDIRFLEDIDNNDLTIEELNDFIVKYSSLAHYSYYDALDIIKNNLDSISNDYSSIKGGIMCTLFETASDNDVLSGYCSNSTIERREMTLEEQEAIMLEMCDNLSLTNDEKLIVLAVFRHETGNGKSNLCVNSNNYGGIRLSSGEFGIYQTPEYGIYRTVKCINRHINNQKNNGYTTLDSIVAGMSYSYCPATATDWTNKIYEFVGYVSSDYNNFEKGNIFIKEYE